MAQQTAVEWLVNQYHKRQGVLKDDDIEKAKSIERKEIEMAAKFGYLHFFPEDYYDETYNKNAQQTATEWLCMQLLDLDNHKIWPSLLERAKYMDKQQIINAILYAINKDKISSDKLNLQFAECYYKNKYENNK